jgi:ferredoxin
VIDAVKCTECKDEGDPQCVAVCPVDCIVKA